MATIYTTLPPQPNPNTTEAKPYLIEFDYAPTPQLQFFLKKHPTYATKAEAFKALANYEFEFGVRGNVYTKFGLEKEDAAIVDFFVDEDVPQ